VRYEITKEITETGACHCEMCRRWSGGVFLGVEVSSDAMQITGDVSSFASSPWAERCFCATCGSSLWYRVTAPGPHSGTYHVGFGTLDDGNDMTLASEIFIDRKPATYRFEGQHQTMTEAEVLAMFESGG
jgi:hypothetical protein